MLQPFNIASSASDKVASAIAAIERSERETVVYVDIGSRSIESQIARDGVTVAVLPINPDRFRDVFGGTPAVEHKIVSQSVRAGTSIAQGTTIHIELAQPGAMPVGIIDGVLLGLVDQPISEVYANLIEGNREISRLLARTADSGVLSSIDQVVVEEAFEANGFTLTDEPGNDIAAALQTLQAVNTFG